MPRWVCILVLRPIGPWDDQGGDEQRSRAPLTVPSCGRLDSAAHARYEWVSAVDAESRGDRSCDQQSRSKPCPPTLALDLVLATNEVVVSAHIGR